MMDDIRKAERARAAALIRMFNTEIDSGINPMLSELLLRNLMDDTLHYNTTTEQLERN